MRRDATLDDIRRAYRKLAKRHHPDLNPGNASAEEHFKAISSAHELQSDTEKRRRFDNGEIDGAGEERVRASSYRDFADREPGRRHAAPGSEPSGWSADDLGEIFGDMFGGRRRPAGPQRGSDKRYTLTVDFLDAVNGATKRLTLPDGRTLDVKIPPGTSDGHTLRLRGQGGAGTLGGDNGDALIEIQVSAHAFFRRDGANIRVGLPVTVREAVLGGSIEVPTPGGPVRMRIPPGSDTGTNLRLRGRGVPAHGGREAGDLLASFRVVVGTSDAALEAFMRQWSPENPTNPRAAMGVGG